MKKTLVALVLVLALIFSFTGCYKEGGDGKETNAEKTTMAVPETDKNGETVPTETTTAYPLKDGESYSDVFEDMIENPDDYSDDEYEAVISGLIEDDNSGEGVDMNMAISDEAITVKGKDKEVKLDDQGQPADSIIKEEYLKKLQSGKFTFSCTMSTTDSEGTYKVPMTYVCDGGKYYIKTTVDKGDVGLGVGKMTISLMYDGTKSYIVFGNLGYMSVDDEDEEMGLGDITGLFSDDMFNEAGTFKGAQTVTFKNVTYDCYTYEAEDGSTTKFYVKDGELKRIEMISETETMCIDVVAFTSNVDSSVFNKPKGKDWSSLMESMDV